MNAEGISLLRALIFKMWSLNEARENGDCQAIADEVSRWMPPGMQVTADQVYLALGGTAPDTILNSAVLREKIDQMPTLFSARLSGDYQAILNEVRNDPLCKEATLADIVQAMAHKKVVRPEAVSVGAARLQGASRIG